MGDRGTVALVLSAALFGLFFFVVAYGAATRAPLLGNVVEASLLTASVLCFVVGVLSREAAARRDDNQQRGGDTR